MRSRLLAAILAAVGLGTAATAVAASAGHPAPRAAAHAERVVTHSSKYGTVIFTGRHRSIYLFQRDRGGKPSCYGACAKAWPPVLTKGKAVAGPGVRAKLLGTVRRKNGSLQVTYGGHPLYGFAKDKKSWQITCQNVSNFGGKWLVVDPAGKAVR